MRIVSMSARNRRRAGISCGPDVKPGVTSHRVTACGTGSDFSLGICAGDSAVSLRETRSCWREWSDDTGIGRQPFLRHTSLLNNMHAPASWVSLSPYRFSFLLKDYRHSSGARRIRAYISVDFQSFTSSASEQISQVAFDFHPRCLMKRVS